MRVGSIVYATQQGLGILARAFYEHKIVTDVLVITHSSHPEQTHWYLESDRLSNIRHPSQASKIRDFCKSMDVMLFFETPFDWGCVPYCKKSVLMTMYECTPESLPAIPDVFFCPSVLDLMYFRPNRQATPQIDNDLEEAAPFSSWDGLAGKTSYFTPVPVEVPWSLRQKARTFVHNSGHGGLKGRNGTAEVLEAWQYVKSDAKLIVRSQKSLSIPNSARRDPRITLYEGTYPYHALWETGDVFLFPEKFNGLSLPLQEARAAGLLVMCGDRIPMNTWLPRQVKLCLEDEPMVESKQATISVGVGESTATYASPLIPPYKYAQNRIGPPYTPFLEAQFDPKMIAAKVDEWYGRDIMNYSLSGKVWAHGMSWETLGPKYIKLLESICGRS